MRAILFATAFAASIACHASADETKSYDNEGFTKLKTSAGVSVTFETAPDYSVNATFKKGTPENLKIRQYGDTLTLSQKNGKWGKSYNIHVHITGPELSEIHASSGSTFSATGIAAQDFEVDASSGASVDLSGTCTDFEAEASSGSSIDAKDLECQRAEVDASSGASVRAYATDYAESDPSSGASVRFYGNPAEQKAKKSWSGGSTNFD